MPAKSAKTIIIAGTFALFGLPAFAQSAADAIVADLTAQGYTNIEVKTGATTTKVEGTKDGTEVEYIVDNSTGEILKEESGPDDDTPGSGGGSVGSDDGPGHDVGDDHGGDNDDDDDDDHGGHGGDDDGDDDHGGHGSDDDGDDDHGGHGGDDDGGDDHGGEGRG